MVFTLIENKTYVTHVPKFVEIQNNDHHSIQNFVHDLEELNIYEKLHTSVDSRPEENYGILLKLLFPAKDNHLPTKIVKFNRKKHKRAKWMTNGILKSINTKDKFYKKSCENGHGRCSNSVHILQPGLSTSTQQANI